MYNLNVLEEIAVNLPPLRSKIRFLLAALKRVDDGITKLEKLKPENFLLPLIVFAKPTENLENYVKEIKLIMGDSEMNQWYRYRRVLMPFGDALNKFGIAGTLKIPEVEDSSRVVEQMIDTFNERYIDDSSLYLTDLNYLRRLLHAVEDSIRFYKDKTR